MRGVEMASCRAHTPCVAGSSPAPATMPKITVTKEHRRALDALFSERDGLDHRTWEGLRDLRHRIVEAYDAPGPKGVRLPVARFLEIADAALGARLGLPPEESRTSAWYGKLSMLIGAAGLTEDTARELCEGVARWATRGIPVETLLAKATVYLSSSRAEKAVRGEKAGREPEVLVDKGLFDE